MPYLPYSPSLEQIDPEESAVFEELSQTMLHITRTMATHYRHAYRPVHAKSHAALVGTLDIHPNLPVELAQGLFAKSGSHAAIIRFSTNPGDLLADSVSSPRGMALKILDVEGEMLPQNAGRTTQDFLCLNAKAFGASDPKAFLQLIKLLDKTLEFPEALKQAVSTVARGANEVLRAVGIHSGALDSLGHPYTHVLGETYSTVASLRYGDYVAKISIAPVSENLKELTGKHVDSGEGYNPHEEAIREFFKTETAVWEMQAQLGVDIETTPIEDVSKEWAEDAAPFQTVATLTVSPQESYSDSRQIFIDEKLWFGPWQGLAAHQPLGGIMRARRDTYVAAQKYREQRNERQHVDLKSVDEVPA